MKYSLRFLWFSLLSCAALSVSSAQGPPKSAEVNQKLSEILASSEFHPTSANSGPLQQAMDWLTTQWQKLWKVITNFWNRLFGAGGMVGGSYAIQWLFIILFTCLLAYLLYRVIKSRPARMAKRLAKGYSINPIEEDEPDRSPQEWEIESRTLATQRDFTGAYRAIFRAALANLRQTGKLKWRRDATTSTFLNELKADPTREVVAHFEPLATGFVTIWYGGEPVDHDTWSAAVCSYEQLNKLVIDAGEAQ